MGNNSTDMVELLGIIHDRNKKGVEQYLTGLEER